MSALRFLFTNRFTRYDALVIVTVSVLYSTDKIGVLAMIAILLVGFAAGSFGEEALARQTPPQHTKGEA